MNAMNPFQIPACFETSLLQRRQERLKRTVFAIVAAGILLMLGLLIEGCVSARSARMQSVTPLADALPAATETTEAPAVATATETPAPLSLPAQETAPQPLRLPVAKVNAPAAGGQSGTLYVVKTGDTLTKIARAHGTTVQSIKSANGMDTDHISVGQKLKLRDA